MICWQYVRHTGHFCGMEPMGTKRGGGRNKTELQRFKGVDALKINQHVHCVFPEEAYPLTFSKLWRKEKK